MITIITSTPKLSKRTFNSRIVAHIGKSKISRYNAAEARDSYRFDHVLSAIQSYAYRDRQEGIPYRYENICYGIRWAVTSGRVNAETVLAMRALKVSALIALVYEIGGKFDTIGDIPAHLMQKYTKIEAKVLQ